MFAVGIVGGLRVVFIVVVVVVDVGVEVEVGEVV